jgi:hypothetical protein
VTCRIHWRHHKALAAQWETEAAYSVPGAPFLAFHFGTRLILPARPQFRSAVRSSGRIQYSPQKQNGAI